MKWVKEQKVFVSVPWILPEQSTKRYAHKHVINIQVLRIDCACFAACTLLTGRLCYNTKKAVFKVSATDSGCYFKTNRWHRASSCQIPQNASGTSEESGDLIRTRSTGPRREGEEFWGSGVNKKHGLSLNTAQTAYYREKKRIFFQQNCGIQQHLDHCPHHNVHFCNFLGKTITVKIKSHCKITWLPLHSS